VITHFLGYLEAMIGKQYVCCQGRVQQDWTLVAKRMNCTKLMRSRASALRCRLPQSFGTPALCHDALAEIIKTHQQATTQINGGLPCE
jgi:hypothetical protein